MVRNVNALERHQFQKTQAFGSGQMGQQQLAARATMRRHGDLARRDLQAQRPIRLDPVQVDQRALAQHRQVAALANLADHPSQHDAPFRGGAVVAQDIESEPREAFANHVGAAARLATEKTRFFEKG